MSRNKTPKRILFLAPYAPGATDDAFDFSHFRSAFEQYNLDIFNILKSLGFDVLPSRSPEAIMNYRHEVDYVFNLFEGEVFESGYVVAAGVCEAAQLPFLGASAVNVAIDSDKLLAKTLARRAGIPTADWVELTSETQSQDLGGLEFPIILKPRLAENSSGLDDKSIIHSREAFEQAVIDWRSSGNFAESFIEGSDVTIGTIGNGRSVLVGRPILIETRQQGNIQTFEYKMNDELRGEKYWLDPGLAYDKVRNYAERLYQASGPWDFSRLDFRITPKGDIFLLENNICASLHVNSSFTLSMVGQSVHARGVVKAILHASFLRQGLIPPWPIGRVRDILPAFDPPV